MSTHKLELDNSHIILAENGKRYVLDTGSPFSFADEPLQLSVGGETVTITNDAPVNLDYVNGMGLMEKPVDGLIGMNILNGKTWEIDFKNLVLRVNEPITQDYADTIPLQASAMTGLIFSTKVNGNDCNAILDTGAFVSYAAASLIGDAPAVGKLDDANPMLGEIHTTVHEVQVALGSRTLTHKAGKMPQSLEGMLAMAAMLGFSNLQFVMGISSLGLDNICLDLQNNKLMF